jgi:hypothetical protein
MCCSESHVHWNTYQICLTPAHMCIVWYQLCNYRASRAFVFAVFCRKCLRQRQVTTCPVLPGRISLERMFAMPVKGCRSKRRLHQLWKHTRSVSMQHNAMHKPTQSRINMLECVMLFVLLFSRMHVQGQELLLFKLSLDHTTCKQTNVIWRCKAVLIQHMTRGGLAW